MTQRRRFLATTFFRPLVAGILIALSACQTTTLPTMQQPGAHSQAGKSVTALPPSEGFNTKALIVTPPTPVPLPSITPASCPFPSEFIQDDLFAPINSHYEIYGRGIQQETFPPPAPADDPNRPPPLGTSRLTLRTNPDGSLYADVDFNTKRPENGFGNYHHFSGQFSIPAHSADEDFSYSASARGSYVFEIYRADYSIAYVFVVPAVDLSVRYTAATRTMQFEISGASSEVSAGTRGAYNISGGAANFTGTAAFTFPCTNVPPTIDVLADPGTISGSGSDTIQGSSVGVAVNKKTTPWKLDVTAPEGSSCGQPQQSGVDNTHLVFPFDASTLGNGLYTLKGYYPAYPSVSDTQTIQVSLPVAVTPDKSVFDPQKGETVTFDVKAPPCPQWNLELKGAMDDGSQCTRTFQGEGNKTVTWDGTCSGSNPEAASVGTWVAKLQSSGEERTAQVDIVSSGGLRLKIKDVEIIPLDGASATSDFSILQAPLNDAPSAKKGTFCPNKEKAKIRVHAKVTPRTPLPAAGTLEILGPDGPNSVYFRPVIVHSINEIIPFEWDGKNVSGLPLPDGKYEIRVTGDISIDSAQLVIGCDSSVIAFQSFDDSVKPPKMQTSGKLFCTVKGKSFEGQVIARSQASNNQGLAIFTEIPAGDYTLTAGTYNKLSQQPSTVTVSRTATKSVGKNLLALVGVSKRDGLVTSMTVVQR